MRTLLHNATLVLPERVIERGWLLIEGERILALGEGDVVPGGEERTIDAAMSLLLPGLIDLHSDAIERLVEPRPAVHFALPVALSIADRQLAAFGITTEFHAVSIDDNEFGVRSDSFVRDIHRAIADQQDTLVRHKLHIRLELSSERGGNISADTIAELAFDLISLMDHSPGQGQYANEQLYREYMMRTTGKSYEDVESHIEIKRQVADQIPLRIERIARLAREAGLALATHDDDSAEKVERWPALGISVSEFPTTLAAARRAHELGLAVCMGAPNVLRGRSSGGNLSALQALQAGVADILCADYYPPAMLLSIFKLVDQHQMDLASATRLVTINPARAVGLGQDYGSLAPSKIADLILVHLDRQGLPAVQRLFVGGQETLSLKGPRP